MSPSPESIWGKVYVQAASRDRTGVASYHFVNMNECYISYANAPATWIHSDGSPFPSRKPFEQCRFNYETRTFEGIINWSPVTTADGDFQWKYKMVFSSDFTQISSGTIEMLNVSQPPAMHRFGVDLLYFEFRPR